MKQYNYRICLDFNCEESTLYTKEFDTLEKAQKALDLLKEVLDWEDDGIDPTIQKCEMRRGWLIKYKGEADRDYIAHADTIEEAEKLLKRESKYRDGLVLVEGLYYAGHYHKA